MEYKVIVTTNEGKRITLKEDKEVINGNCYDYYTIQRGDFWQLLSDIEKGKIKSFSVSLQK